MLEIYYLTVHLNTASIGDMPLREPMRTSANVEIPPAAFQSQAYRLDRDRPNSFPDDSRTLRACVFEGTATVAILVSLGWNVTAECKQGTRQLPDPFNEYRRARMRFVGESVLTTVQREFMMRSLERRYN